MPHVITITGPSRAGKSTVIRCLQECANEDFKPQLVPKHTTRPSRKDDAGEVICGGIPDKCDLVYQLYGHRYGLELSTLFSIVAEGQSPLVILNDVRAVEDVRNAFRELVRSIFIFREDPTSRQYHDKLVEARGKEGKDAARLRFEQATIYRIYIENMHLFDHVIINREGRPEEMETQVKQIVKGLEQELNWPLHTKGAT